MREISFDEIKEMDLYDENLKKLLTPPEQMEEAGKYVVEKIQTIVRTKNIKFKGFQKETIVNHMLIEHILQKEE